MLPLLNEIDKRNVKEINENYNTDSQNSGEIEIHSESEESSTIQNHSDKSPAISEVLPQTELPEEFLPIDISTMNSLRSPEMPKNETSARISLPMKASKNDQTNLLKLPTEILNSEENIRSSALTMRPKRYICEICINRGFTTKFSLRRHNDQFHKNDKNIKTTSIEPDVLLNSEPKPETIHRNQKRQRDESVETNEFKNFQESKKLKTRGLKRGLDTEETQHEEHLPRKSARIQSYKRKSQFPEIPPKRVAIQKGRGLSNWVNF